MGELSALDISVGGVDTREWCEDGEDEALGEELRIAMGAGALSMDGSVAEGKASVQM